MITNVSGSLSPLIRKLQPMTMLQSRVIVRGNQHMQQVLIQWESMDDILATWEDWPQFQQKYTDINLGD